MLKVFFIGESNELWNQVMRCKADGGFPKMYFNVVFSYQADALAFHSGDIEHHYYYDFGIDKMVLNY